MAEKNRTQIAAELNALFTQTAAGSITGPLEGGVIQDVVDSAPNILSDLATPGLVKTTGTAVTTAVAGTDYVSPTTAKETLGARLRRLERQYSDGNNATDRPYMKAIKPWQPSTAYVQYDQVVNGGYIYTCVTAGTSASSGGPTFVLNQYLIDGSAYWTCFGLNSVTTDPSLSSTQGLWVSLTAYSLGNQVIANGNVYACVVAGTSGSTSPSTTSNAITDGTVTWTYMGVYQTNPYASIFPTVTVGTGAPSGLSNQYNPTLTPGNWYAIGVQVIAGGSGYAVGDTITPATGTFTTAHVFTVTSVSSGAVTGLSVTTPGAYTFPVTAYPTTQNTTSGSGTGCTMVIRYNDGLSYATLRNAYIAYTASGFANMFNFSGCLGAAPTRQHPTFDFYTDAPVFGYQTAAAQPGHVFIIDGVRYNQDCIPGLGGANHYTKFDFTNTGGRKKRHIVIQSISYLAFGAIWVDTNSQVWKPDAADTVTACMISDSTWAGSGYGPFVPGNTVCHNVGNILGWSNVHDFSQGGTGWCNPGTQAGSTYPTVGTGVFGYRIAEGLLLNPDIWVLFGSVNDRGSTYTSTQVYNAILAALQAIRAGGSTAPILVGGCWSISDVGSTVTLAIIEADIQAAITAAADPLGTTYFIPVYGDTPLPWITGTWNNSANTNSTNASLYVNNQDNIHPIDLGTRYFADKIANAIRQKALPFIK